MAKGPGLKRTLKVPGSYRILVGGALVVLLALATVMGEAWTEWNHEEMDLENIMEPPEVAWLKRLLTTEEGLRLQDRNKSGGRSGPETRPDRNEDGDELDFLQGSEATTPEAADPPASEKAAFSDRLRENDQDLGLLESVGSATSPGVEPTSAESPVQEASGEDPLRRAHYLGTDRNGRDLLSLLVAGARTCFAPGMVTCSVALGLGIPLGLFAGYYGGRFRAVIGALNGTVLSMPRLVLILVVICALEPNVYYTMGVLGATLIPRVSELIATRVRILSNMGFILAAKEAALSDFTILYRHLFWYQNRAVFFIQFSLIMAESILVETTLSYLQFGTKPPEVSWGNIIEGSQMSFFSGFYWITFFPAVAIILAILGFFYLGDGLNARLAYKEGR